jgi:hypothetical protein
MTTSESYCAVWVLSCECYLCLRDGFEIARCLVHLRDGFEILGMLLHHTKSIYFHLSWDPLEICTWPDSAQPLLL